MLAFAVWIYRKDGQATASALRRAFLGVLRAALIVLAILILAEPVLLATSVDTRRSVVLVLVDDSFSMDLAFADAEKNLRGQLYAAMGQAVCTLKLADGKTEQVAAAKLEPPQFKFLTRLDVVSAAFRAGGPGAPTFLDVLKEKHDLRFFGFASRLSANNDDDQPLDPFNLAASNKRGGETRLGDALRQALREVRGQPVAGIVLISDGRQNAGEDAVQAAQALKIQRIPIFTVGVGDPSEPRDFEVTFEGPEMILPDDQAEGIAFVRYRGYTGINSIHVEMKNGGKVIAGEDVKLGKPGEKRR